MIFFPPNYNNFPVGCCSFTIKRQPLSYHRYRSDDGHFHISILFPYMFCSPPLHYLSASASSSSSSSCSRASPHSRNVRDSSLGPLHEAVRYANTSLQRNVGKKINFQNRDWSGHACPRRSIFVDEDALVCIKICTLAYLLSKTRRTRRNTGRAVKMDLLLIHTRSVIECLWKMARDGLKRVSCPDVSQQDYVSVTRLLTFHFLSFLLFLYFIFYLLSVAVSISLGSS